MTALELLKAKLIEIGADGLCTNGCGCRIEDGLAPCDSYFGRCVPAKQVTVDEARTRSDLESVDLAMDAERCGGFIMIDMEIYKEWKAVRTMAIKPDDISDSVCKAAVENFDPETGENLVDFLAFLNAALSDPQTRAALVRELIAGGHCSPPVWAVRHIYNDSIITLHKDEAEATDARRKLPRDGYYYCCGHWKGGGE